MKYCLFYFIIPTVLIPAAIKSSLGLNFTQPPSNVIAADGQPLWWHCAGQGAGTVTYRWRFNDADVAPPIYQVFSNGTLHIQTASGSTVGSYQCVITDGQDTLYSTSVTLQLAYLAAGYTLHPSNQNKNIGDTVVLDCAISSLPPASITWLLGKTPVSKGTVSMVTAYQSRLTIPNVDYDSQGEYVCVAVNPVIQNSGRYSNTATLILEGRPGFLVSPSPQSVPRGLNAHFDCVAVGTEPLEVQWFDVRNASAAILLQSGSRYSVLSNGSLLVNRVTEEDAGFYKCQATNSRGQNAVTVLLTVTEPVTPPSFITVPSDMTVQVGEQITLQCTATGIPEPVISWVKFQGSFPAGRTQHIFHGTIRIINVQSQDGGQYVCQASNSQGTADHRVTVTVQVKPYFTLVPVNIDVRQGESANILCKAQGTPDPTITWRLPDGDTMTAQSDPKSGVYVDTSGSLIVTSAAAVHHGGYTCFASNLVGTVSSSIELTVLLPPTLTLLPTQQNVVEGGEAIFNCQASGRPTPAIMWYKIGQGQQIQDGSLYRLFSNGSLKIMNVQRDQAWIYQCVASNSLGNQTALAPLAVIVLPTVNVTPAEFIVDVGQTVTFHCLTTGDPQPLIRWERSGQTLVLDSNMHLYANNSLVIQAIRSDQYGEYTCIASSSGRIVSDTGVIYTKDVPIFLVPPSNVTVNVTDTATLHCSATAREMPTYRWYTADEQGILGRPLGQGSGQGSGVFVDTLGNLMLQGTSPLSEGWYACVASNTEGNKTGLAYITIQEPPSLISKSSSVAVQSAQPVSIQCVFSGKPAPSITWMSPGGREISRNSAGYQMNPSSLHIISSNVSLHWGLWSCQGCNILGCKRGSIALNVQGPPAIREVKSTDDNTSISLTCVAVGTPVPQIQYFTQQLQIFQATSPVGHSILNIDGSTVLAVEKQNVFPSYTCRASNSLGAADLVLTVPGPSSAPYSLGAASTTVQLSWIPDHSGQLPITGYKVQYRRVQPVTDPGWTDAGGEGEKVGLYLPHLVTQLAPFSSFQFRVMSENLLGYGAPSDPSAIVSTLDGAPSPPSAVSIETRQNSMVISWSVPIFINGYTENIAYQITYRNLNTSLSKAYETNQAEPLHLVIENLDYNNTYEVNIRAGNTRLSSGGWSEYVTRIVTVREIVPSVIPAITEAIARGPDAILVKWSIPQNGSRDKIAISYSEVYKSSFTSIKLNASTSGQFAITGLQAASLYQVKVALYNNAGEGPYSGVTVVETGPALFSPVGLKDDQLLTTGTIIGIIGGCVGGLLLVLLLILVCSQQRRLTQKQKALETEKSEVKMNSYVEHDTSNLEFDDTIFNTVNSRTSGIRGFYDFHGNNTHDVSTDTAYTVGRNTSVQAISVKPQRSDIVYKSNAGYYNPVVEEEPLGEHTEIELDTTRNSVGYMEPIKSKKKQNGVVPSFDKTVDSASSHEYAELSPQSQRSSRISGQDEPDSSLYAVVNKNSKRHSPDGSVRSRDMSSRLSTPSKAALGKLIHSKPMHRISISKDDSTLPDKDSNDTSLLINKSDCQGGHSPGEDEAPLPPVKFSQYVSRSLGSRFPKKQYAFPPLDSNIFLAPEQYDKVVATKEKSDDDDDDDLFDPEVVHKGSNLNFENEGDTTLESEEEEFSEEEEELEEKGSVKQQDAVLF